jgi:hypothetical protein
MCIYFHNSHWTARILLLMMNRVETDTSVIRRRHDVATKGNDWITWSRASRNDFFPIGVRWMNQCAEML